MNILLGIISTFFESFWDAFRKKALDLSTLWKNTFAMAWPIMWALMVYWVISTYWSDFKIFWDYSIILITLLVVILEIITNYLYMYVFKKVKISHLLPYDNLDKLLVVIIWFFIFTWTQAETTLTTLLITIFTIIIIILFSIDFKTLKISKNILLYILALSLNAVTTLIIWYILLKYSTIDYMSINVIITFILYLLLALLFRENIKDSFKQKKEFYKPRLYSLLLNWSSFIIWLYIIETAWVIIATLISFIAIITSIIAYKFILNDSPEKKDIILAIIVTILIWIWYYFK